MLTMKKLSRTLRKSRPNHSFDDDRYSLPTLDDARPIDTEDQEEMVRSFEKAQAQQSLLWRSVFTVMMSCYVAFLIYSIFRQLSSPWELRYYAYFMDEIDSWMLIMADLIAAMACLVAILGLQKSEHHRQWMWYSCCISIIPAVFWFYHMLRLPKFRWDALWLPFGPLSGIAVCLYVDHLLTESSEEVRKLRGYMYAYKAR